MTRTPIAVALAAAMLSIILVWSITATTNLNNETPATQEPGWTHSSYR